LNALICSGEGGLQELPSAFPGVALLKDGAARDQDLGAGVHDIRHSVMVYATVYFDTKIQTTRFADSREELDFFQRRVYEGLAAEAGIDAHYKDVMHQGKNFIEGMNGSGRVYHDAGLASVRRD
jgi:hypothetical protein